MQDFVFEVVHTSNSRQFLYFPCILAMRLGLWVLRFC